MKRNLLEESQLRKMMRMGGVPQTLVENFIQERCYDDDMMAEMPEDEMSAPMDMDEPEGDEFEGGLADVEELVVAITDAIAAKTGVEIDVEGGAGEQDPEMDLDGGEEEFEEEPHLEESSDFSAGKPSEANQGRPKPGSFEKPKGTKMPQLEEDLEEEKQRGRELQPGRVDETDELEEGDVDEVRYKKSKRKPRQHGKPSAGGAKVVGEDTLEEADELEEEHLDEMEQLPGDPNDYKMMQKEHMKAMAKEVARNVVASLLEQIQSKKKQ